jgi:O-antigen/teichoic acid export membrane protein
MLSTLVRLVSEGAVDHARDMARDALRLMLLLVPFAALIAGAADGIVRLVFGEAFAPAGPLLARLVFASMASAVIAMAGVVLVSGGELRRPAWILGSLVPATLAGHLWAIPRYGAVGAAWVSTGAMVAGAALMLAAVARMWGNAPPAATIVRTAGVALAVGLAARAWTGDGFALVAQLAVLGGAIPVLLLALGEFTRRELGVARRAALPRRRT